MHCSDHFFDVFSNFTRAVGKDLYHQRLFKSYIWTINEQSGQQCNLIQSYYLWNYYLFFQTDLYAGYWSNSSKQTFPTRFSWSVHVYYNCLLSYFFHMEETITCPIIRLFFIVVYSATAYNKRCSDFFARWFSLFTQYQQSDYIKNILEVNNAAVSIYKTVSRL